MCGIVVFKSNKVNADGRKSNANGRELQNNNDLRKSALDSREFVFNFIFYKRIT